MKILQVVKFYYPWVGGVERVAQQIAEGLNRKGFDIEVLCCSEKKKGITQEINGVRVRRAGSFGVFWSMPLSFSFLKKFKKLRNNFDILHFHHPFPLADLALFLFPSKAKIVVYYHSDIVRQRAIMFFLKPFLLNTFRKACRILVSNPNLIKSSPVLRKFQKKCVVVPFGVDIEEIDRLKDEGEIERIKQKYQKFILFVGRLSYYKGVEYLIKAMENIDINLVIIGKGNRRESLKHLAEKIGVEKRIFFLEPQPRKTLINFYRACEVFVLPSIFKSEAFGLVLLEAMACAKPVISTELGTGTSWINQDKITGFVVPPKNFQAITNALKSILNDSFLREKMASAARARAKKEFSYSAFIENVAKIYKTLGIGSN